MRPLVSIIIAAKNEERNIENCLKSILAQFYPREKIEIIVVDNNSDDNTKEIAKKYTDKVFNLANEINLKGVKNFRGAQLNFGVNKADGEIIFFPDADMTFDNNLINEAVEKLNDFDALFIPEIVYGKGLFGKIRNFERSFYNGTSVDGVRIVKRGAFMKVGGFNIENIAFGPDDWDFTKMLKINNLKIGITDKSLFHHEEQIGWLNYFKKKNKYIKTFDDYIKKWGRDDPDIKKQFGFYYRFFGVFVENGKWKKLLRHPILAAGIYFLRFFVGLKFLTRK